MNWNTAIPIACVVITCGVVLWHFTTDPSVPSDPGKEKRDSLYTKGQVLLMLDSAKTAWTDSVHATIDSMIAHAPPAEVIYLQAYDEALSMAVADKYRFMGQWPVDTAVGGHAE